MHLINLSGSWPFINLRFQKLALNPSFARRSLSGLIQTKMAGHDHLYVKEVCRAIWLQCLSFLIEKRIVRTWPKSGQDNLKSLWWQKSSQLPWCWLLESRLYSADKLEGTAEFEHQTLRRKNFAQSFHSIEKKIAVSQHGSSKLFTFSQFFSVFNARKSDMSQSIFCSKKNFFSVFLNYFIVHS